MPIREIRHSRRFARDLEALERKHRHLRGEVDAVLQRIAAEGTPTGMQIPGLGGQPVFKARLPLAGRGKRGGARIIYYHTDALVIGMYIYTKSDRADIPVREIRDALAALTVESTPTPTQREDRG